MRTYLRRRPPQSKHSMATINLFGAGGHAKVVIDIIEAMGHKVGAVFDNAPHCGDIHGIPVYKADEVDITVPMIIAIGSPSARKHISETYDPEYFTAIHPDSTISPYAEIGHGSVVMPGAIINVDAKIGRHCIINTKASVDHDCRIGDFAHIAPGATVCGNVHIGKGTWIGVGACIKQGIRIGENCMIGAGSVVVKDIPDNSVAYGNPCRIHKSNPEN